jgi:cell cycle checkpoint protein
VSSPTTTRKRNESSKFKTHKSDESAGLSYSDRVIPAAKRVKTSNENNDMLLSEKYEPKTRSELMVHKNKVDELSNFIDSQLSRKSLHSPIVLLTGPPGCGKFVTLKVLCKEKNIDLVMYNSSILKLDNLKVVDEYNEFFESEDRNYQESQLKLFEQFLFKSSRYSADQIFCSADDARLKRVIFVKEIPNSSLYETASFHSILRKFAQYSKSLLVFSLNLTTNSTWENNQMRLFSNEIRNELKITEISFNAFANSFMLKALNRVICLENFDTQLLHNKDVLNELCASSNGDLRFAINSLDFYFHKSSKQKAKPLTTLNATKPKSNKTKTLTTKKSDPKELNDDSALRLSSKDMNFNLFKGIGKILHRKNIDKSSNDGNLTMEEMSEMERTENKLAPHLKTKLRKPLAFSPEDVHAKLPLSSDSTMLFLNQNYLEMFRDRPFAQLDQTFESLIDISESFCLADLLSSKNYCAVDYSNTSLITYLREYSSIISMRSMLFNSYKNSDTCGETQQKGLWKPLHKPYYHKANDTINQRKRNAIELFLHNTNLFQNVNCQKNEFFQVYLPYLALNYHNNAKLKQQLNFEQKQFLNSMLMHFNNTVSNPNKLRLNNFNSLASMKIGQNDNFAALNDEDTGSDLPKFGDDSNGNEVNLKASLSSQFKLSQLNTQIKSNLYEYENGNFVIADVQL